MGRPRIETCKGCGRRMTGREQLSHTYQCPSCGETNQLENRRQLMAHSGPWFDHWRSRIAASVGATLDGPRDRA